VTPFTVLRQLVALSDFRLRRRQSEPVPLQRHRAASRIPLGDLAYGLPSATTAAEKPVTFGSGARDSVGVYLSRAIASCDERQTIIDFNDSRESYAEIRAVILHARELAQRVIVDCAG
jgi:hypothetical protein